MTFIECYPSDDWVALARSIREAYAAVHGESLPFLSFGREIEWNGRRFRQLELSNGGNILGFEDGIYRMWKFDRARILIGSVKEDVFTSPPQQGEEAAARLKEGGRCGRESMVKPFLYAELKSGKEDENRA